MAEELYVFVERLVDEAARDVFRVLYEEGKELPEEEIAEKTNMKLNAVRKALNQLAAYGLVVYRRIRDLDKPRSEFLWRVNYEGLQAILIQRKRAVVEKLRVKLEQEESEYYYICPLDGSRYTMDEAMEYDMLCPRCGSPLEPDEGRDERIALLRKLISELEEEIRREQRSAYRR